MRKGIQAYQRARVLSVLHIPEIHLALGDGEVGFAGRHSLGGVLAGPPLVRTGRLTSYICSVETDRGLGQRVGVAVINTGALGAALGLAGQLSLLEVLSLGLRLCARSHYARRCSVLNLSGVAGEAQGERAAGLGEALGVVGGDQVHAQA